MRKFILFFVLTLLLLIFGVFFFRVYVQSKYYLDRQNNEQSPNLVTPSPESGKPSVYTDYTKEDYDRALDEKRVLVLFFTSNWCSECLNQEIINDQAFSELDGVGAVGLRIHILDSETTTETDAIARKFDITKESSYVFLDKSGKVSSKYVGSITNEALKQKILEVE